VIKSVGFGELMRKSGVGIHKERRKRYVLLHE